MNSKLKKYAMTLMVGMGVVGAGTVTVAYAEDSVPSHTVGKGELRSVEHDAGITSYADIGAYSQYVFRGLAQSANNDFSIQGDVGVEHESGLSANVWFATGVDTGTAGDADTEYDITLDYSGEAGDIGYSVGYIRYDYLKNPLVITELYVAASYNIASATLYVGDTYKLLEFGVGDTVADLFDASVTVGYGIPDTGTSEAIYTNIDLSKEVADGISASLTYAIPQGGQKTATTSNEVVVAVNASF